MAKKKTPAAKQPTDDQLALAKTMLAELPWSLQVSKAKLKVKRCLGAGATSGDANALVLQLRDENFMGSGERIGLPPTYFFFQPEAPRMSAVVVGSRTGFRLEIPEKPDDEVTLPDERRLIPGDVYEVFQTGERQWHPLRLLRKGPRSWVFKVERQYGDTVRLRPVSPFFPMAITLSGEETAGFPNDVRGQAVRMAYTDASEESETWVDGVPQAGTWRFVEVVGALNDPLGEMRIAAENHGVPIEFSEAALAEAAALPERVAPESLADRVDLTDIAFVTIDGEDARDFDDAVYCEETADGWRLLVAIADVSHYVQPGSALDRDAQMRGTSVYFAASVVPMLPEKLSNGLCSLNPNTDRLVLVCDALVNREGLTTAYQFYPAVIHSKARLTYTQVWAALEGDESARAELGERTADVERLYNLYKVLREARARRFALEFERPEPQAILREDGRVEGFRVREHNDAHRLIEECMLVANVCAAQFVLSKNRTALMRVHPKPTPERERMLREELARYGLPMPRTAEAYAALTKQLNEQYPFLSMSVLRAMSRAVYSPENIGHFGLQYPAYTHFTSPIRRYPDLLVHRVIRSILTGREYVPTLAFDASPVLTSFRARQLGANLTGETPSASGIWGRLGVLTSAQERRADDATRDAMNYLMCDYAARCLKKRYLKAHVMSVIDAGLFVRLDSVPIEGFVHVSNLVFGYGWWDCEDGALVNHDIGMEICAGDEVEVKLETVDMDNRRLSFICTNHVGQPKRGNTRRNRRGRRP